MKNDFKNPMEQALIQFLKEKHSQVKGKCLTDNDMASLLDGKIPANKRDAILEHVLSCQKCADDIKEGLETLEEFNKKALPEVPKELLRSAIDLMPPLELEDPFASSGITDPEVLCYPMARAGRTITARAKRIKKISFTSSTGGLVYLFKIKKNKVDSVVSAQKVLKGKRNDLVAKSPLSLLKKKSLVLVLTKTPIKNLNPLEKILLNAFKMSAKNCLETLNKEAAKQNIMIKLL